MFLVNDHKLPVISIFTTSPKAFNSSNVVGFSLTFKWYTSIPFINDESIVSWLSVSKNSECPLSLLNFIVNNWLSLISLTKFPLLKLIGVQPFL